MVAGSRGGCGQGTALGASVAGIERAERCVVPRVSESEMALAFARVQQLWQAGCWIPGLGLPGPYA